MFLLFLFGLIFFTTLITHYFFSFDGISITETPLRDDTAVCSSMCRPLEKVNTARCCVPKVKSGAYEPDSHRRVIIQVDPIIRTAVRLK